MKILRASCGHEKCHTQWKPAHEHVIGRRLQDGGCVLPHADENGSANPKVPMPKDKHKKWLSRWSEIARIGMTALGLQGFFALHCFRRGGA